MIEYIWRSFEYCIRDPSHNISPVQVLDAFSRLVKKMELEIFSFF